MQMHHFVLFFYVHPCVYFLFIFFFFFPMVFPALMSNCTPNLNYMRKKDGGDVRRVLSMLC